MTRRAPLAARVTLGGAREEVNMPNRELGTSNGSGPRRGVQTDGGDRPEMGRLSGSGAQPREISKQLICVFQAKLAYHTTYRTSLESSH